MSIYYILSTTSVEHIIRSINLFIRFSVSFLSLYFFYVKQLCKWFLVKIDRCAENNFYTLRSLSARNNNDLKTHKKYTTPIVLLRRGFEHWFFVLKLLIKTLFTTYFRKTDTNDWWSTRCGCINDTALYLHTIAMNSAIYWRCCLFIFFRDSQVPAKT